MGYPEQRMGGTWATVCIAYTDRRRRYTDTYKVMTDQKIRYSHIHGPENRIFAQNRDQTRDKRTSGGIHIPEPEDGLHKQKDGIWT